MKLADTLTEALAGSQAKFLALPPLRSTSGRRVPYEEIHRGSTGFLESPVQHRQRATHENRHLARAGSPQ